MQGDKTDVAAAREQILEEFASNVIFDGWSERTLETSVARAGFEPWMMVHAFPAGLGDVARGFSDLFDARMLAALEEKPLDAMRVRDRVTLAVRMRFEAMENYREVVRAMLGWYAMPGNAPAMTVNLYRTCDAIWHACGDTSTDFNFYTKRGLLAGVITSTLLAWLEDDSEGREETWAFLDRRIENVMQIGKQIGKAKKYSPENLFRGLKRVRNAASAFTGAFGAFAGKVAPGSPVRKRD